MVIISELFIKKVDRARVVILALLLIFGEDTIAQTDSVQYATPSPANAITITTNQSKSDKTESENLTKSNKAVILATTTTQVEKEHSAAKALLWSLLPGAGQIYNRQAWKIPIIYAGFAGVGYFVYFNGSNMSKFKTEYLYRVNNDGATQLEAYKNYPTSNIYNLYQSYNRNFQLSIIIGVAVYGLNLIDAYVFGHLFDYDISDDVSLSAAPSMMPVMAAPSEYAPTLSLTLTF